MLSAHQIKGLVKRILVAIEGADLGQMPVIIRVNGEDLARLQSYLQWTDHTFYGATVLVAPHLPCGHFEIWKRIK